MKAGNYTDSENKPKLLILTPGFPDGEEDSKCIPAMQIFLKELLRKKALSIIVISIHYPYKKKDYEWHGIKVYALGGNNKKGWKKIRYWRKAIRLASKINGERKINFLHSFWLGECAWLGNKLAAKFGVSHSCTLMGQDVLPDNSFLKKVKPLPKLIALSEFQQQCLKSSIGREADYLIPWGIEETEKILPNKGIDIIGVGWLNEVKGFSRFIHIISKLKEEFPDVKAEIIGEGDLSESLKTQVEKLQLSENVKLIGSLERQEAMKRISKSRVLLHTARFESFGMVFIEALASGTKIFSTPVGIALEIKEATLYRMNPELIPLLADFLRSGSQPNPSTPYQIEATVNSYLNSVFLASN